MCQKLLAPLHLATSFWQYNSTESSIICELVWRIKSFGESPFPIVVAFVSFVETFIQIALHLRLIQLSSYGLRFSLKDPCRDLSLIPPPLLLMVIEFSYMYEMELILYGFGCYVLEHCPSEWSNQPDLHLQSPGTVRPWCHVFRGNLGDKTALQHYSPFTELTRGSLWYNHPSFHNKSSLNICWQTAWQTIKT